MSVEWSMLAASDAAIDRLWSAGDVMSLLDPWPDQAVDSGLIAGADVLFHEDAGPIDPMMLGWVYMGAGPGGVAGRVLDPAELEGRDPLEVLEELLDGDDMDEEEEPMHDLLAAFQPIPGTEVSGFPADMPMFRFSVCRSGPVRRFWERIQAWDRQTMTVHEDLAHYDEEELESIVDAAASFHAFLREVVARGCGLILEAR